jgi:hypothetical protein
MKDGSGWRRHFFYTATSRRTTWKVKLAFITALISFSLATRSFWIAEIGRSLQCTDPIVRSDILVIENFDPNYMVFKRAAALVNSHLASRVLVPIAASGNPLIADPVSKGIAEVMARQAGLEAWDMVLVNASEPIALNTVVQIRDRVRSMDIRSILVVTTAFRSRRTSLVYHQVFDRLGVRVSCAPVVELSDAERWTERWHGIQEVTEELLKLYYYRFYVIPVLAS